MAFGEGAGRLRFLSPEQKVIAWYEQMPGFLDHQSDLTDGLLQTLGLGSQCGSKSDFRGS